jgi:sterol desaturase/sphingolipid hydroxylase (fatty acid hydroxylase superfamily)
MPDLLLGGLDMIVRLTVFAVVFTVMACWEIALPAHARSLERRSRWRANLGMALLNTLVIRVILPTSAIALAAIAAEEGWGLLNRIDLPAGIEVAFAIVALDFVVYLQHVLFHAVPLFARLHAVHHADLDFDLTTGIRFHPFEIAISAVIKLAAVAALGAPPLAVFVFELLLNASAMFNHANVSLPARLERFVRRFLVTPDMHRIHHSVIEIERNSNYGFCLSLWDRAFGSYTAAAKGDLVIGLTEWRDPSAVATLTGVLSMPFKTPHAPPVEPGPGPRAAISVACK